jgi:hypothetical protein
MAGSIYDEFLDRTTRAGLELAAQSDVLVLVRLPVSGVGLYFASFQVPYLARRPGRAIEVADGPLEIMIHLGPDYLRQVHALEVVQVRQCDLLHPNFRWPVLCVGDLRPGMPLPMLLRHTYEILTYQNFATDDGLDGEACQRLRDEPALLDRLPRPSRLTRRRLELSGDLVTS